MPQRKLRLLAWCDSPLSITGFGVVAKNILNRIYATGAFDVACVGINHFEEHAEQAWVGRDKSVPYKVFIGQDIQRGPQGQMNIVDPMGRMKALDILQRERADIFFMMRDLWDMTVPQLPGGPWLGSYFPLHIQLAKERGQNFRTLLHFPLEYELQPDWKQMLDWVDYGYCFTAGGMHQLLPWSNNIKYAPQGADGNLFFPLKANQWGPYTDARDFRSKKMLLQDPDCFLVVNVNRNQPRKDIRASMQAFKKLKQKAQGVGGKRPVLWLHMRPDDSFGDAREVAKQEGLIVDYDVQFPPYFNVGVGWSDQELNMLYNTADVFISTSVAEGFGLTPVEAGFAGCPVLVPAHSGFLQTVGQLGMPYVKVKAQEVWRNVSNSPITPTDTDDMAKLLFEHYVDPNKLKDALKKNLTSFRDQFDWDNIFKRYWIPALETIAKDLIETPKRQEQNKKRYLYVCEEAFGDILGATKAIAALKDRNPDVPLDFMSKNKFKDVVGGNPFIDRVLDWNINKIFDYPEGQCFYPHAKIRHGGWAFGHTHLLDMQAEMLGLIPGKTLIVPEEFDTLLDIDTSKSVWPIITINTSSQGGKMISPEKWAQIIFGIASRYPDIKLITVGGPDDLLPAGTIDMRFEPGTDKVLSYRKMAYLQQHAFAHIGIDSGPGHCASTMDTPSIIFWGWTNVTTCKPENHSINIVPHFPTVCPAMGPCHGVQPKCGINQYDRDSAMRAPCISNLDITPAVQIINEALELGLEQGKEYLKNRAKKIRNIYSIPAPPAKPKE